MGTPTPAPDEQMYTPRQVANILGYHRETVRVMCRSGELRYTKGHGQNGRIRIFASSVEDWKRRNTYNPAA